MIKIIEKSCFALAMIMSLAVVSFGQTPSNPRLAPHTKPAIRVAAVAPSHNWEVNELVRVSGYYINQYWSQTFTANGLPYTPPRVLPLYDPPKALSGNAAYVGATNTIYYDYNFFYRQLTTHGDFAVVTILAHEWGHLAQHQARTRFALAIERELQADCYAGAFAKSETRGPRLEPGDLQKSISALLEAGDDPSVSIIATGAHGTREKRRAAFIKGLNDGLSGCGHVNIATLAIVGR
jgi:predicted metalloprotease